MDRDGTAALACPEDGVVDAAFVAPNDGRWPDIFALEIERALLFGVAVRGEGDEDKVSPSRWRKP